MRHPLQNHFTAQDYPLRNLGLATKKAFLCQIISQPNPHPLQNTHQAHVCHFATQTPISQLRNGCEILQGFISQPKHSLRNAPLAHECHFAAPHSHFVAAEWLVKCPIKMPLGYKIASCLRNEPPPTKISIVT